MAFLVPNLDILVFFAKFCNDTNSRVLTILFSNSSPKIPKSGMFGPRFKHFYFCTKLCSKTNSRVLISNMTILFSNSSPKIPESRIFGPKFKDFCFCTKRYYKTDSRMLISNSRIFFQIPVQKYSNKAFLALNLGIFLFFCKILLLGKFEGADLKHGNSLLQTLAQKY